MPLFRQSQDAAERCLLPLDAPVPEQRPTPDSLPPGQHEIAAFLARDAQGDPVAPRHMRGFLLDIRPRRLGGGDRRRWAAALRAVEETYSYAPSGVFALVAYGQSYFDRHAPGVTVPPPRRFGETDERAVFTGAPVFLQLLSDHLVILDAIERAFFAPQRRRSGLPAPLAGVGVRDLLRVRRRITGALFPGAPDRLLVTCGPAILTRPLRAETRRRITADQSFFLGFKSNFAAGNATEAEVTLPDGVFAGGTYAQVSHVLEDLDGWYAAAEASRAQRMFQAGRPDTTRTNPPPPTQVVREAASGQIVGHNAKVAMGRQPMPDGSRRPLILRRDYPSVDLGRPGLQFVALVRDLAAFDRVRQLMEGRFARDLGVARRDNGLNAFLRTLRRDTFVVPPRALRAFPVVDPDRVGADG